MSFLKKIGILFTRFFDMGKEVASVLSEVVAAVVADLLNSLE